MRALLALTLLAGALPAQDDGLQSLIRRLDDESIEVRDKASQELVLKGEPALPALEKVMAEAGSEETRARLKAVIEDIRRDLRRRKFEGGNEVNGLKASLKVARVPKSPEIIVTVEIMNVSKAPAEAVPIQDWDLNLPAETSSSTSAHAAITVRSLSRAAPGEVTHEMG